MLNEFTMTTRACTSSTNSLEAPGLEMISMHVPTLSPFVPHLTLLQNFVLSERPHLGLLPPLSARRRRARRTRRRGGRTSSLSSQEPHPK